MPTSARLVSCYEAGRDGFWLHGHLVSIGTENQVVDVASIEVSSLRVSSMDFGSMRRF